MATTIASLHIRSISLPCTSHPLEASIEDQLRRLSSSQAGSSSSSSVCQNLYIIKDLYENMNDLISLPHSLKAFCKGQVEEVLEGSLALLDASGLALDVVSQMKEAILELQSSLRRGNKDEGIHAYSVARKKITKTVSKSLANLKKANKNSCSENNDITLRMLNEAGAVSLSILKALLSFVMGKKTHSWSLVAKLVKSSESNEVTKVEEVDRTLRSLSDKQVLQKQLEALEMIIHEFQDGLESISRCLVKTRVSLLNVVNH